MTTWKKWPVQRPVRMGHGDREDAEFRVPDSRPYLVDQSEQIRALKWEGLKNHVRGFTEREPNRDDPTETL